MSCPAATYRKNILPVISPTFQLIISKVIYVWLTKTLNMLYSFTLTHTNIYLHTHAHSYMLRWAMHTKSLGRSKCKVYILIHIKLSYPRNTFDLNVTWWYEIYHMELSTIWRWLYMFGYPRFWSPVPPPPISCIINLWQSKWWSRNIFFSTPTSKLYHQTALRPKGYCRHMCPSVRPYVCPYDKTCQHDNSRNIFKIVLKLSRICFG